MNREDTVLRDTSRTEKDKHCSISFTSGIYQKSFKKVYSNGNRERLIKRLKKKMDEV